MADEKHGIDGRFAWEIERTLRTYAVIWRSAQSLVCKDFPPNTEEWMSAGVLAAFSFEAYLNHVGDGLLESWGNLERRLGWREKLSLIVEVLAIRIDYGTRPFQLLPDLFTFRDTLAHGKTKSARITTPAGPVAFDEDAIRSLIAQAKLKWERDCESGTSVRIWMEAVEEAIRYIHNSFVKHPTIVGRDRREFGSEPDDPFAKDMRGRATLRVVRECDK